MKLLIVLALVASAFASPNYGGAVVRTSSYGSEPALRIESHGYGGEVRSFQQIPILRQSLNDDNYGTYNLELETGNGIRSSESGVLRDLGGPFSEGPVSVKSGSYSYTSPEGIPIHTSWTADENGFRAQGAHLPVPPPIPAEIARSLHSSAYGSAPLRVSSAYDSAPVVRVSSGYSGHSAPVFRSSTY